MILNYVKLAFRLLSRNLLSTLINVAGLSIGLASFYILWTYSQYELRTDQFHSDYRRIARLARHVRWSEGGAVQDAKVISYRTGFTRAIANEIPEITDFTRILPQQTFLSVTHGMEGTIFISVEQSGKEKEFYPEKGIAYADPNIFQFFSLPVVNGDPATMLSAANTAALSERIARKYFGNERPENKIIYLNDSVPFKVTGVFRDLPRNTHLAFDILLSSAEIKPMDDVGWDLTAWWGYCYVKLREGSDFKAVEKKIHAMNGGLYDACPHCFGSNTTVLQSIDEVVFERNAADIFPTRSYSLLIILSALSFVVLGLAWINYATLSVSLLNKRRKEMGTRKVVGAGGQDLAVQFFIEALILNIISIAVALTIVQVTKGPAENLFHFYLPGWMELPLSTWMTISGVFALGVLITGIYPVVITRKIKAIDLLKKLAGASSPNWPNVLVAFQYAAAIAILGWVTTVYFQLNFVMSRDVGFDKDGVIVIDAPLKQDVDGFSTTLQYFIEESRKVNGVNDATLSNSVAGDDSGTFYGLPVKRSPGQLEFGMDSNGGVDERFLSFYGVKLVAGRNFLPDNPADRESIMISHDAAVHLGFRSSEEALGAKLYLPWQKNIAGTVIGIYEDYEFRPFLVDYESDAPLERGSLLTYKNYLVPTFLPAKISVKVKVRELTNVMEKLSRLFNEVFPSENFHWRVLNENINRHYDNEKIARNQIMLFTVLAVGIACLGLLGIISNKIIQKTKEIGIRKILGAEPFHVVCLLMNVTIQQIIIAAVAGMPLSYLIANIYLQRYSVRIDISWWHFALPVCLLFTIMLLTVMTTVLKATGRNPVDSLRHE
jgi:putative ABC transport system permease protein